MLIVNQFSRQQICRLNSVLNKPMIFFVCSSSTYHLNGIAWERYLAIQKFTYYKDSVNYKKPPPKNFDSRMVFSRVHAGLRSYNGTVVQIRFLYTRASTVALICLIAIAYFYFMMYLGMRLKQYYSFVCFQFFVILSISVTTTNLRKAHKKKKS